MTDAKDSKDAKTQTKKAATKKVAAKKEPVVRDTKNGISRPSAGTMTGKVWEISDKISGSTKKPATREAVLIETGKAKINPSTAATQYGKWRKYNGLAKPVTVKAKTETKAKEETAETSDKKATA